MFTASEIRTRGSDDGLFETVYLARQPILNVNGGLAGYELLFRSSDGRYCDDIDGLEATANVIRNAFYGMGIRSVLAGTVGFINVDERFLCSELVEALEPRAVVLEILETVQANPVLMARIRQLRTAGYRFALDDYTGNLAEVQPFLEFVDIVKFDLMLMEPSSILAAVKELNRPALRLLAEKVETNEQFELAKSLGFTLFQGFHFAKPERMQGRQARMPNEDQLIRLISLLQNGANDKEVLDELKHHPMIVVRMLRVANSSAMALKQPVNSLSDAFRVLGQRQVLRIINVLLFAGKDAVPLSRNPLFQVACARGKLLETLVQYDDDATIEEQDGAFLVGILSLVDGLLAQPMHRILEDLGLASVLNDALLLRGGLLGRLLRLIETLELGGHEADCSGIGNAVICQE